MGEKKGKKIIDNLIPYLKQLLTSLPRIPKSRLSESQVSSGEWSLPREPRLVTAKHWVRDGDHSRPSPGPSHTPRERCPALWCLRLSLRPIVRAQVRGRAIPSPSRAAGGGGSTAAEEAKRGLGEGVQHIWIPGPEPAFLPGEWEVMGSQESCEEAADPLLPHCNRTHLGRKTTGDSKAQSLILGSPIQTAGGPSAVPSEPCPIHTRQPRLRKTRGDKEVETSGHGARRSWNGP